MKPTIIYTITDEAPALATASLLPVIRTVLQTAGIDVQTRDISLAARVLSAFPEYLKPDQRVSDDLAELGELVTHPDANVIKLPNISASLPQMTSTIRELQENGYALPDYPEEPRDDREREIKKRYDLVKGSAVNPVLREGNSDRRVARSVKQYAKHHPHSMGAWQSDSRTHVASMTTGDFYGSERSIVIPAPTGVTIEFVSAGGAKKILKERTPLLAGEIIDAAVMSRNHLRAFLEEQVADARAKEVLFSIHLKASMMKVSDPIIFGHAVSVYFRDLFEKHADLFGSLKISPDNGIGDLLSKIRTLPDEKQQEIRDDIDACYARGPALAMVDSDRGITSLHVPSDFIIDATMPAAIRSSGKLWGPDGRLSDMKAVIPDQSYAAVYQTAIDYCKTHGAFDPATMGSVSNVGFMAQKAEEYGSHDKTFLISGNGVVRVVDDSGAVLIEQAVEDGDIFRMCQAKDIPIREWVKLAVSRARETGSPAVFWLDAKRSHDALVMEKVRHYLAEHEASDPEVGKLDIRIMSPAEATQFSLERLSAGKDTISVTGNVLRDYLTDLFPILELGTSAKMLSIVPLLNGGRLFETGAAGSAPKHVLQFVEEGHLRWDSLGEFLALQVSLEHLARTGSNPAAELFAQTLDIATEKLLENGKSPSRKSGELDNRGSHFYHALYWSQELAARTEIPELQEYFGRLADEFAKNESRIMDELRLAQGKRVDIGGYYKPDEEKMTAAMRPSKTFNGILDRISLFSGTERKKLHEKN